MADAYILDGCRSPIGRGHPEKGIYKDLRADELMVQTLVALLSRNRFDQSLIDDFYLGCVGQHLEQGKNLARLVLLLAGLPQTISGATINRLCASSFSALQMASDSIKSESNSIMLVGGVEHLGHVPITAGLDYNPALFEGYDFRWSNMGLTAEKLAEDLKINRTAQDQFTVESNHKYFESLASGFYDNEMIPIKLPDGSIVQKDQEPRLASIEKLGELKTPFKENGTVTAANSSGISDGACAALICSEEKLSLFQKKPLCKIIGVVNIGLEPDLMGLGPVYAIRKLLRQNYVPIEKIDLFEINEAFAVQVLACQKELNIPSEKLNIHGGAVALGHPLGMSGLRIVVTLAHSMVKKSARYGVASMCVGHGQGVAMLLERE